jgi:peptidoglycan/LPS O-acetylase OafA/YrhL
MTNKVNDLYTNKRYEELDALRGIAALLVVLFHLTMRRPEYNTFFKLGVTGVDLFFIISGFVIFMSLQKISSGADFIINRVSRLYPTYWVSVTFTFVLLISYSIYKCEGNIDKKLIQYLGNLTMFEFYLRIPYLDGPYWTLIIEMLFYIFILFLFQKKWFNYLSAIGIVLCSSIVLLTHYYFDINYIKRIIKWLPLLQFLPLFFAGTTFYKIYKKNDNLVYNYSIIVFCFICQVVLFPYAGLSKKFISWTEYNIMLFVYFSLFLLFVNNRLTFIVNKTTLFFGKISYALYLIHQFISSNFIIPFFYSKLGLNFWVVAFFIDLPIVIGIATFITFKIEAPYSKKMKEKLRATAGLIKLRF